MQNWFATCLGASILVACGGGGGGSGSTADAAAGVGGIAGAGVGGSGGGGGTPAGGTGNDGAAGCTLPGAWSFTFATSSALHEDATGVTDPYLCIEVALENETTGDQFWYYQRINCSQVFSGSFTCEGLIDFWTDEATQTNTPKLQWFPEGNYHWDLAMTGASQCGTGYSLYNAVCTLPGTSLIESGDYVVSCYSPVPSIPIQLVSSDSPACGG
jgi:hypothetical protein